MGPFLPIVGGVLLVFCFCVAFAFPPFYQLVRQMPFSGVTSARRMLMGVHFGGALLTAVGLHWMFLGRWRSLGLTASALAVASVAVVGWLFFGEHLQVLEQAWREIPREMRLRHPGFRTLVQGCLSGLSALILTGVAAVAWLRRPVPAAAVLACVVMVALEMTWSAWDYNPTAPVAIADPPAPATLKQWVEDAGEARITAAGYTLSPNLSMRYGFRDVRGYDLPLERRVATAMLRAGILSEGRVIRPALVYPVVDRTMAAFLDRYGTRFLVNTVQNLGTLRAVQTMPVGEAFGSSLGEASLAQLWVLVGEGPAGELIYRNPNAYPRAYIPRETVRGNEAQALEALLDPLRDLRRQTVLEDPGGTVGTDPTAAEGTVRIVQDREEQVVLESDSRTGGVVVLADRMAPGWRVTVDDRPAPVLTANYLFRAVKVPAGRHRIRWTYHAPGLRAGVVLSVMSVLALLAAGCWGPWRVRWARMGGGPSEL